MSSDPGPGLHADTGLGPQAPGPGDPGLQLPTVGRGLAQDPGDWWYWAREAAVPPGLPGKRPCTWPGAPGEAPPVSPQASVRGARSHHGGGRGAAAPGGQRPRLHGGHWRVGGLGGCSPQMVSWVTGCSAHRETPRGFTAVSPGRLRGPQVGVGCQQGGRHTQACTQGPRSSGVGTPTHAVPSPCRPMPNPS